MRRAARVDANHKEFITKLRKCKGYSVHDTSRLGDGFPDIVVGAYAKYTVLVEIKDPKKPSSARKLTEKEIEFKEKTMTNYIVALYPEQVIEYINKLRYSL